MTLCISAVSVVISPLPLSFLILVILCLFFFCAISGIGMVILSGQRGLLATLPPLVCLPGFGAQFFPGSDSRPGLCHDSLGAPTCGVWLREDQGMWGSESSTPILGVAGDL